MMMTPVTGKTSLLQRIPARKSLGKANQFTPRVFDAANAKTQAAEQLYHRPYIKFKGDDYDHRVIRAIPPHPADLYAKTHAKVFSAFYDHFSQVFRKMGDATLERAGRLMDAEIITIMAPKKMYVANSAGDVDKFLHYVDEVTEAPKRRNQLRDEVCAADGAIAELARSGENADGKPVGFIIKIIDIAHKDQAQPVLRKNVALTIKNAYLAALQDACAERAKAEGKTYMNELPFEFKPLPIPQGAYDADAVPEADQPYFNWAWDILDKLKAGVSPSQIL